MSPHIKAILEKSGKGFDDFLEADDHDELFK